jgi:ubiquinone/menaquinone biosynthesis C-methylase UbiE
MSPRRSTNVQYMQSVSPSDLNAEFWNELCGTNLATKLGISDWSPKSLAIFDSWYFNFYPYLKPFLSEALLNKQSILEVGLGFGSVSTFLASSKNSYTGLDIAESAVAMCNSRLFEIGKRQGAVHGDALSAPFHDSHFEAVVAIGSLHHTGDFDQAISEMVRVVKLGGVVCGMVYSIFSLRNFLIQPVKTIRYAVINFRTPVRIKADEKLRWLSDHNQNGEPAPSTEYFSRKALKQILGKFGDVKITTHNLGSLPLPFGIGNSLRKKLIRTKLASLLGLDLYFIITLNNNDSDKHF